MRLLWVFLLLVIAVAIVLIVYFTVLRKTSSTGKKDADVSSGTNDESSAFTAYYGDLNLMTGSINKWLQPRYYDYYREHDGDSRDKQVTSIVLDPLTDQTYTHSHTHEDCIGYYTNRSYSVTLCDGQYQVWNHVDDNHYDLLSSSKFPDMTTGTVNVKMDSMNDDVMMVQTTDQLYEVNLDDDSVRQVHVDLGYSRYFLLAVVRGVSWMLDRQSMCLVLMRDGEEVARTSYFPIRVVFVPESQHIWVCAHDNGLRKWRMNDDVWVEEAHYYDKDTILCVAQHEDLLFVSRPTGQVTLHHAVNPSKSHPSSSSIPRHNHLWTKDELAYFGESLFVHSSQLFVVWPTAKQVLVYDIDLQQDMISLTSVIQVNDEGDLVECVPSHNGSDTIALCTKQGTHFVSPV
jgi:hypothetical protein